MTVSFKCGTEMFMFPGCWPSQARWSFSVESVMSLDTDEDDTDEIKGFLTGDPGMLPFFLLSRHGTKS